MNKIQEGNDPSILAMLHEFDDKVERFFPISQQTKMHQKLCQICHFLKKMIMMEKNSRAKRTQIGRKSTQIPAKVRKS